MNSKGPYEKKCSIEAPETHPDILRGDHRNPYQLETAIKRAQLLENSQLTLMEE